MTDDIVYPDEPAANEPSPPPTDDEWDQLIAEIEAEFPGVEDVTATELVETATTDSRPSTSVQAPPMPPRPSPLTSPTGNGDTAAGEVQEDGDAGGTFGGAPVDWPAFWAQDHEAEQWVLEPLIPQGRSVSIVAKAGAGKSTLCLEAAAAIATGRAFLDQPAGPARRVAYIDMEMTEDDVRERLQGFGYGPGDDLSRLVYYLMPDLLPLDTEAGGHAFLAECDRQGVEVVVIDTFGRTIAAEENSADGVNAYVRHTANRLKNAGISVVRLDHLGKDPTKGGRGTSAKAGDVDVEWQMTRGDADTVTLEATKRRIGWVPAEVKLQLIEADDGTLGHRRVDQVWPVGTEAVAHALDELDELDVPIDAPYREAMDVLREDGRGRRRDLVAAAQRWRRLEAEERSR